MIKRIYKVNTQIFFCILQSVRFNTANYYNLDNVHEYVYFINMKTILFYRTSSGNCPVENHLETLTDSQVTKITWVLKLIILTNSFQKKTQKIPRKEIKLAEKRKKDFLSRG